jgi:hypothetical protein
MDEAKATQEVLDAELNRRLEEYGKVCRTGCEDCLVPPLTLRQYMPAVIISIVLTVLIIVVGVMYYA